MCYIYKTEIPETDWEKTTACVKERMEEMRQLILEWGKAKAELEAKQQEQKRKTESDIKELIITTTTQIHSMQKRKQ